MERESEEVVLWKAPRKERKPDDELHAGFGPTAYPGHGPYFALERELAEEWQAVYENGLQEIHLPRAVFEQLIVKGIIQVDGYYPDRSICVPSEGLAEFNWRSRERADTSTMPSRVLRETIMLEIGSIVRAEVTRIEPYGAYLKHGDDTIIVLAPEASWTDSRERMQQIRPGQSLDILVIRFNYQTREFVGSLRRLQKEQNPYRQISRLAPGCILKARVVGIYSDGVSVSFQNGAHGNIPGHQMMETELKPGQEVMVMVAGMDVEEGILTLDLVSDENGIAQSVPAIATH